MKKSLVLAMAMALGVTASAYAANPFSDVPAGHWAYDSISKLAAAGVVDGYPDGSFKGDNLMTRYEMAQIVAKAMAKGANVDALAAEFAEELDNLGVRVAALEKKADNVKITGQIRYHYAKLTDDAKSQSKLRSRITLAGQINEDWKYTALYENVQDFRDNDAEEGTAWQRAYINGKLGGLKVQGGRFHWEGWTASQALGFGGDVYAHRLEGAIVEYGKAINVKGIAAKLTKGGDSSASKYDLMAANVSAKVAKPVTLNVGYYNNNGVDTTANYELIDIGAKVNVGKNVMVTGDWLKVNNDGATDGNTAWIAGVMYKGAKANKVGSWGLAAKWIDAEADVIYNPGWNSEADKINMDGGRGYGLLANYTFAKNIVGQVEYYNVDNSTKQGSHETLWSQVVFTF